MSARIFQKTETPEETVTITFDEHTLTVPANVTVAAALLGEGINRLRNSVVGDKPRAPYCLMGICFECLVTIDGVQNRQACMMPVANGMVITSQSGARRVGS
ncbi:(2Fe-2S)-binding protein [Brucella sp. NBRC 12950]|uniref:(2Fe-2S)-binding protein n=1 Tax=Brucella sp. NBRC 12950 TaxID=2994518 RepID=UPI0024A60402|nr:(2Fe-2S)-binding protein [Brucella sp. NBRC 12950]GLU29036.1 sarcosine oxidase subunit alpha [Brucella sp. NBRC 12950]